MLKISILEIYKQLPKTQSLEVAQLMWIWLIDVYIHIYIYLISVIHKFTLSITIHQLFKQI